MSGTAWNLTVQQERLLRLLCEPGSAGRVFPKYDGAKRTGVVCQVGVLPVGGHYLANSHDVGLGTINALSRKGLVWIELFPVCEDGRLSVREFGATEAGRQVLSMHQESAQFPGRQA